MNDQRAFWEKMLAVTRTDNCALLCVVESIGSSPGRKGFKMCVSHQQGPIGSIGGGSMEHKLVELAIERLTSGISSGDTEGFPFLKRQIHKPGIGQDRSGMICSGEQTVAFFYLGPGQNAFCQEVLNAMDSGKAFELVKSSAGIRLLEVGTAHYEPDAAWSYRERLTQRPRIAIVGGGHVGLALSRSMNQLGFHVVQFDHREVLNTMDANEWAHEKKVIDFHHITDHLPDEPELFIALVSFGYRTDAIALRQLIRRRWKYLGMLGSAEKVRTLFDDLRAEGFTEEELARVHAPIGLPIHSKTPEEIAVSIAAEIVRVKNRGPA